MIGISNPRIYLRGGLLFLFLGAVFLSFSDLMEAGSDNVGVKYFLPDPLPILSDLGRTPGFFTLCLAASVSYLTTNILARFDENHNFSQINEL